MICKYFEKKIELLPDENDEMLKSPIILEYYLLESKIFKEEEFPGDEVYGIEIIKRASNKNIEIGCIRNFSHNKETAKQMLYKLADNTVTPVGLPFVLDDIIGV